MFGRGRCLMLGRKQTPLTRIHMSEPFAAETLALSIGRIRREEPLVVVCVGTDRSTGDSLGPLIGSKLEEWSLPDINVYGTLDSPVHALNLDECLASIKKAHPNSGVLAIDACLGKAESIGYISLKAGPLKPGTGVNKTLPSVGDYHVIGVVNVGGFMEYFVLQNTRLSLVMKMAQVISEGIKLSRQTWAFAEPVEVFETNLQ